MYAVKYRMQIPNTNEAYTYLDVSDKVKIKFAFFSHAMKVGSVAFSGKIDFVISRQNPLWLRSQLLLFTFTFISFMSTLWGNVLVQ